MGRVPSAGWREVYSWFGVETPGVRCHEDGSSDDAGDNSAEDVENMNQECPDCGSELEQIHKNRAGGIDELAAERVAFEGEVIKEFETMVTRVYECPNCSYEANGCTHSVQYMLTAVDGERGELQKDPAA